MEHHGGKAGDPTLVSLQNLIREKIGPVLTPVDKCIFYGFPDHGNVGDSMIYAAARRLLRDHGVSPHLSFHPRSYRFRSDLIDRWPRAPLIITGGALFGDVWKSTQQVINSLCKDNRERPIMILPNSIHFRSDDTAEVVADLLDGRNELTVFARDEVSQRRFEEIIGQQVDLVPDLAFYLDPVSPSATATKRRALWVLRRDRTSRGLASAIDGSIDWAQSRAEEGRKDRVIGAMRWLEWWMMRGLRVVDHTSIGLLGLALQSRIARRRILRGLRLLCEGEFIVTDRLHVHIASMLLGKRHVLLDNSVGKVANFYNTWTYASPLVRWADNADEARAIVASWSSQAGSHERP